MQKLSFFGFPTDELICYLDCDMLCLGDITAALQFRHFTATLDVGRDVPFSTHNRPNLNGGFFVVQPSRWLLEELQAFAESWRGELPLGDQSLLAEFFYQDRYSEIHFAGLEWNLLKRIYSWQPRTWGHFKGRIKFLHFVGKKPWEQDSDEAGNESYKELNDLWRMYYKRAIA
jgi:lipopolysaccharide biosynthesis glycosyltransferase